MNEKIQFEKLIAKGIVGTSNIINNIKNSFGKNNRSYHSFEEKRTSSKRRLYKSRKNKILTGTLAGIANYFGIDATILRILFLIVALLPLGPVIPLYILAAIFIPKEPLLDTYRQVLPTPTKETKTQVFHQAAEDDWTDF